MIAVGGVNRPDIVAEVAAAFARYEAALCAHEIAVLNDFFLDSPHTVRFGVAEHAYGIAAVHAYRRRATPIARGRRLQNTVIATFGTDAASVCTEFTSSDSDLIGRQTQTWVRTPNGWRIAAAHVSYVDPRYLVRD